MARRDLTTSTQTQERFTALDSLRGLAAMTVVIWHIVLLLLEVPAESPYFQAAKLLRLWQFSPLYPLMAGREAVIIFFILSGFVLSLPWLKEKQSPYPTFLTKRICRIYLPYLTAVILAFTAYAAFGTQAVTGLAGYIGATWTHPPGVQEVAQHLLLIGSFDNEEYALVLWSLVHEMRVSIIFPLLMVPIMRWSWAISLTVFFVLSLLGTYLSAVTRGATDYPATLHYLIFFVIGAVIAKNRVQLVRSVQGLGRMKMYVLFFSALLLYTYARVLSTFFGDKVWVGDLEELFMGVGASLLIVGLLASVRAQQIMTWSPLVFLGRISYSLYLLHPLVLLSLVHTLAGYADIYLLFLATIPISIFVAWLSYCWVEKPSMSLGKWLTTREQRRESGAAFRGFARFKVSSPEQ